MQFIEVVREMGQNKLTVTPYRPDSVETGLIVADHVAIAQVHVPGVVRAIGVGSS